MEPIKLILDTDIGTDIDDAIALALAMLSPELDLIGVTTVNSDTALRARIARKLIQLEGRQVPVARGIGPPLLRDQQSGQGGHEARISSLPMSRTGMNLTPGSTP